MNSKPPSVICAGRIYCDLIFTGLPQLPVLGQETFAENLELHAGGGAFITAASFAALGLPTSIAAVLPSSPFDKVVLDAMAQTQVDATLCVESESGVAPQITVATAHNGDRAFLTHQVGPAVPDLAFENGQFTHLHIGEMRTLVQQPDLLTNARAAGMTVSSDCGWDAELMKTGHSLNEFIEQIDVFLPNASEFEGLLSSGLDLNKLPLTVVKLGKNGAKLWDGKDWRMAPTEPVEAIDTTGAGDAFNGGFLSSWLMKAPLSECLNTANACGSATVQSVGGTAGLLSLVTQKQQPTKHLVV